MIMMRNYEYNQKWQQLLTPEIVTMISQIHEFRGEQNLFIEAKRIEGCSEKTLNYYKTTLIFIFNVVRKEYFLINTEDLRNVLSRYKLENRVSKTTIDNVRRIISTFFSWLENEDYIQKSPCRRIHKVRTGKTVK